MSCDDFKVVKSKRRGKKPTKSSISSLCMVQGESDIGIDIQKELQKINNARDIIDESAFTGDVKRILQEALDVYGSKSFLAIVCFGLGHFVESNTSRYQLALLLSLQKFHAAKVYVHDPIFYRCEVNILKELGFSVVEENEEGKHQLSTHGVTLLYLPHCPKQLVNNFLWKNWGPGLSKCVIFSNSFSLVVDRLLLSNNNLNFVVKIQPYTQEFSIDNNFKYLDVFNDTSVHIFPEYKLSSLQLSFWSESPEEPVYSDGEIELVRKKQ